MNSPPIVASRSMPDGLSIDGARYRSTQDIAREYGYTRDYVARLCREGKVRSRRLTSLWYVDVEAFAAFVKRDDDHAADTDTVPV
jgi:class 3 adenylate cyclase